MILLVKVCKIIIIIIHNSAYTSSNSKLLLLQDITFTLQSKNGLNCFCSMCLSIWLNYKGIWRKIYIYTLPGMHIFIYYYEIMFLYSPTLQSVFFISSYGAPLAQRASYLALHSSLFGPAGAMIILSLTSLTLW